MCFVLFFSQERRCHWQLPIRSCSGSMLKVANQLEAFTLSTKVILSVFDMCSLKHNNICSIQDQLQSLPAHMFISRLSSS